MTTNAIPLSVLRMQLEAIKASMDNHANTRELALSKTKIEECMMWLNQHLYLNPEYLETQDELPLFNHAEIPAAEPVEEKKDKPVAPKKKAIKVEPKEEVQTPKEEILNKPTLPSKDELIQLAKDFGKAHGVQAFLDLLKLFNCKNVSEVYGLGTEAIERFYANLNS